MTLTKIYKVEDNKVIINLPAEFRNKKKLLITVNDIDDSKNSKLSVLKQAVKDPLFLSDNEIRAEIIEALRFQLGV
ncbi:MAG: hypothetical protein KF845_16225 [Cyclobacteriaceae bacterium]|nr:hypothetical protein [Cyclobacteriaceae bacterium]